MLYWIVFSPSAMIHPVDRETNPSARLSPLVLAVHAQQSASVPLIITLRAPLCSLHSFLLTPCN